MGSGDSKLQFRSRINNLVKNKVTATDHEFWSVLFTAPLSLHDIFSLISPNDVRDIRTHQPGNLGIIIFKAIEQLYLFSQPENFGAEYTSARNSLRLLTRILPFVFEHNDDGFIDKLFFQNRLPLSPTKSPVQQKQVEKKEEKKEQPKDEESKSKKEEEKEEKKEEEKKEEKKEEIKKEGNKQEEKKNPNEELKKQPIIQDILITHIGEKTLTKPLAQVLIDTLMEVSFIPGFCIPPHQLNLNEEEIKKLKQGYPDSIEPQLLWDGGLCVPFGSRSPTSDQILNRTDVLRCFLAAFSSTLYIKVNECNQVENRFLTIATSNSTPHNITFLLSLLNTILTYDPTGSLPYSSVLASDPHENLVDVALHVLCTLLHYKFGNEEKTVETEGKKEVIRQTKNVFISTIAGMKKDEDFKFIFKGFSLLLNNRLYALNTYLPSSQKMIECHEELLVVLWKLLDENKDFRLYISKYEDVTQIVIPLLHFIYTSRQDQAKFPLIQMASFILLLLSSQREFGIALNTPFDQKVPSLELPIFSGNYAELLIIVLHKVIVTDKGICRPLFDCLLTIICNISPYTKSLSMVASVKLLGLFEAFSSKKFLYAGPKNHQYVYLLLEIFNNLIQYQYEGNTHLVYAIIRRKKVFWELTKTPDLNEIKQIIENRRKKEGDKKKTPPFEPTEEWLNEWKQKLPLQTCLTLIKVLVPEVERLCVGSMATEEDVLAYLKKTTLVGLLPVPHTIVIRTFQSNAQIDAFLTTYIYGLIYLRNLNPPMFDAKTIKLFTVNIID